MNDPLKRKMFRQVGMSKQPIGILASSPELMTTAQKAMASGQPIKAKSATSVNFMPQLNLVPGTNRKTPFGGYETKKKEESPLSAFGGEGPYISPMIATTGSRDFLYELGGDRVKKQIFDKAGEDAKNYYESQTFAKNNPNIEGGDVSVQKSNVDGNAINASNKNILSNALIMVDQQKMRKQELENQSTIEEESGIAGDLKIPKGYGNVIKPKETKEENKNKKTTKREDFLNNVPQIVTDKSSEKKGSGIETKGSGKTKTDDVKVKNDNMVKLLSSSIAENKTVESNETVLKAHGYSKEDIKKMSVEDQVKETRALIQDLYGKKDMGLDDDLESMNLIMLGLSIAAGTSPDALQNIANGGKDFIKRRTDQIKEKKKVNQEIDMLTLKTVLGRQEKERDYEQQDKRQDSAQKHDMRKISVMNKNDLIKFGMDMDFKTGLAEMNQNHNMKIAIFNNKNATDRFNVKLKADANNLVASLDNALTIAENNNESADNRAKAASEAAELRSVIGNLDKGYGFALIEGKNQNLEGDALIDFVQKEGKKFAKNPYLTGPDSLRRLIINNAGVVMKEQQISFGEATTLIFKTITSNPELKKFFPEVELNKIQEKINSQVKPPINLTTK